MICRHFATSSAMSCLNSARVVGLGSAPISIILLRSAGSDSARTVSLLSRSTIEAGVPFGASSANQAKDSKPLRPASSSVGVFGKSLLRYLVVMAKALT